MPAEDRMTPMALRLPIAFRHDGSAAARSRRATHAQTHRLPYIVVAMRRANQCMSYFMQNGINDMLTRISNYVIF